VNPHVCDNSSANDRTLRLCKGYHRHNYPPALAHLAGLQERFAVVLDTSRHNKDHWFFDVELFLAIVEGLSNVLQPDKIRIEMEDEISYASIAKLAVAYAGLDEEDCEPPARILLSRNEELVGIEETEFWSRVGGPEIYHDSYTISFFTAEDRSVEFRTVCGAVVAKLGAKITGFHEGEPRKAPFRPLWKKLLGRIYRFCEGSQGYL